MKPVTRLDAKANELWEESEQLRRELNRTGKERRRLTLRLPWWAAPGRSYLSADGKLEGEISGWPAIQEIPLPGPGAIRIIRPSPYHYEQHCNAAWWGKERAAAMLEVKMKLHRERVEAQNLARREVGLNALERSMQSLRARRYEVRDELRALAGRGSMAGIAATILWDAATSYMCYPTSNIGDCGPANHAVLKLAQPYCTGTLRKNVTLLVEHPRKERRTWNFGRLSDDADGITIAIDGDRFPGRIVEIPAAA